MHQHRWVWNLKSVLNSWLKSTAFNIVLEVSEMVLISFNSFFFFPLWFIYFYHSIFEFTNPIFCLCYSTICCLQSVFSFIYCSIQYILTLFLFLIGWGQGRGEIASCAISILPAFPGLLESSTLCHLCSVAGFFVS